MSLLATYSWTSFYFSKCHYVTNMLQNMITNDYLNKYLTYVRSHNYAIYIIYKYFKSRSSYENKVSREGKIWSVVNDAGQPPLVSLAVGFLVQSRCRRFLTLCHCIHSYPLIQTWLLRRSQCSQKVKLFLTNELKKKKTN